MKKKEKRKEFPQPIFGYALGKVNYCLMLSGYLIVIVGFLLMLGPTSGEQYFEPDIFSVQRIGVAPVTILIGFLIILIGIIFGNKNIHKTNT